MDESLQPNLTHAGVLVYDIDKMRDFYLQLCKMVVSDEGSHPRTGRTYCFITSDKSKHHQLVLVSGRSDQARETTVFQFSFRVGILDGVRQAWLRGKQMGAANIRPLNHGNAWSVYMDDPEGNTLEFYCDTPWYIAQPFGEPLDFEKSDAEIYAETEKMVKQYPEFKPVNKWQEDMHQRLEDRG